MAKPVQLDAEVAVRLWGFRWWCSRKNNPNQLCVLHVPDSWLNLGWYRCNWGPGSHEILPAEILWPHGEYSPYVDWYNGIAKEDGSGQMEWSRLPAFSSDWKATGMVIEWLVKNCSEWIIGDRGLRAVRFHPVTGNKEAIDVEMEGSLQTAICRLAVRVCGDWRLGDLSAVLFPPVKEMQHPFGYHADECQCAECLGCGKI